MRLGKMLPALVLALVIPVAAQAAEGAVVGGFGPRVGFSSNPDQLVLGGQALIGGIAPDVTFDPNIELGVGDNVTTVQFNFDFKYHLLLQGTPWRPYMGAGIGLAFFQIDNPAPFRDNSDTEVGGNFILGAGVPTASGSRFFTELRAGIGNLPDLKLVAGWNFKM